MGGETTESRSQGLHLWGLHYPRILFPLWWFPHHKVNSFLHAFLPQWYSAQPGLNTLKPSAKPVGFPLNCLLGVFARRGTDAQCLALSESLKPFCEDWLIFIVNLTRFRVSRRPHSGCVYDGVSRGSYLRRRGLPWVWPTLSCGLDPETEFGKWERQMSISSHVSQLPDRESDAHTPAQCSCPLVLHHTVPHSQTESQNKLVFPQVACLSVFLFTATRITNTNCWFAELSMLAGPHRLTTTGRG